MHQVTSTQVLQFAKSANHLTSAQQQENATFISMLESVLSTPNLYFSYTADLSRSMQRKWEQDGSGAGVGEDRAAADAVGLFTKWDERFVWNRHMLGAFLELGAEFLRYCLPVIQGAAFVRQCSLGGRLFRWSLISRRSNKRAGTR